MTNELIMSFLEQMIDGLDGISEALRILLQYYHVTTAESEFEKNTTGSDSCIESKYTDIDSYIEPGNKYMDTPSYINLYTNSNIEEDID